MSFVLCFIVFAVHVFCYYLQVTVHILAYVAPPGGAQITLTTVRSRFHLLVCSRSSSFLFLISLFFILYFFIIRVLYLISVIL